MPLRSRPVRRRPETLPLLVLPLRAAEGTPGLQRLLHPPRPGAQPHRQSPKQQVAVIVTYERDSIWTAHEDLIEIDADMTEPAERAARYIRLDGRTYRYQPVASEEVIRLLEQPNGRIPIHRVAGTGIKDEWRLRLLRDLRGGAAG